MTLTPVLKVNTFVFKAAFHVEDKLFDISLSLMLMPCLPPIVFLIIIIERDLKIHLLLSHTSDLDS